MSTPRIALKRPAPKRSRTLIFTVALLSVVALVACSKERQAETSSPIRLGWQPPWANQGQIVALLKRTDILAKEGVRVEFVPFTYGGPMTEAALAGRIDVVFAGEQPVLTLLSRSSEWRIVARLTSYRSAILVPTDSTVRSFADLKGKTIATAFGSTTHRDLARILADKHLDSAVKVVSLDQAEHASVIQRGGEGKWGEIDGIATYDPTIAAALAQGKARILHAWASPALVAVHQRLIANRRSDLAAFLRAYATAYTLYAANPTQANAWYSEESRLPLDDADYAAIAEFEPNMQARTLSDVDVRITDTVLAQAKRNAEVALKLGIIKSKPDLQALTDRTFFP